MEKQEEIEASQWASKVIGRSSVADDNEANYGAQRALGPADNGKHGGYGWHSLNSANGWIELAFDKDVIPTSFELLNEGGYYPTKIFGRGPANELIEVYNNPQAVSSKGKAVGFEVDLKKVETPMKQFRFEIPDTASQSCTARLWAVRLIGILESHRLRREKQPLDQTITSNQTTIDQLNDTFNKNSKDLAQQSITLQALGLDHKIVVHDEAAANEITILRSTIKQLNVEKQQMQATIQQLQAAGKVAKVGTWQQQENALVQKLQSEIGLKRKQIDEQRDVINNLQVEIGKQQQRLAFNEARIKTTKDGRDATFQDLTAQLAASQAAKTQLEQANAALQVDFDNTKAQLIALQAAKSQLEQVNAALQGERDAAVQGMTALKAKIDASQAKLIDLQHKLDQQSVQGIVTNIDNATVQDVLTLAAYQHVDVSSVHVDKLAVAHILAFDSFDDYFDDSEAEPDQRDGLLKLYATIKTAKDTQQLASNVPVSVWINKQPRHQDESIAKKMDEAATRFDEKGYTESMLRYLDPRGAAAHLGLKAALLASLKKDLIASQEAVHLLPMPTTTAKQ